MWLDALAQGAQGAPAGQGLSFVFMSIVVIGIWWFLVLKPQRAQEQKHKDYLGSLKPGARVITSGGLYGTISQVGDKTFKLKIADNVKVDVSQSAIAGPQPIDGGGQ